MTELEKYNIIAVSKDPSPQRLKEKKIIDFILSFGKEMHDVAKLRKMAIGGNEIIVNVCHLDSA